MRSPKLAALELKRFGRGKLPRAALVALLLLPLLYGALYLWSFWDPYSRLDKVPVALVNSDRGATVDGKHLDAGGEITKKLRDSKTFDWREVSPEKAAKGLEDGTYYLTLTMPADFSEKIASSSGEDPTTGALQVRTNDANNYVVGSISRTVFSEVRSAASANASRGFLDKIFVSFSDLHDKTAEAADGADKLKDGAGKAQEGAKELADGLDTAGEKSGELANGLKKLNSGAAKLETGTRDVANGTQLVADKVNGAADKARPFVKDPKSLAATAELVADSAKVVKNHLDKFAEKAPAAAAAAKRASTGADAYYTKHCVTPGGEPHLASCPDLKKVRDDMAEAAELSGDVSALAKNAGGDVSKLRTQLTDLENKARDLADKAPHLAADLDAAVAKVNALNTGAHKVATGMAELHTGLGTATTGSGALSDGVGKLGDGAHRLDGGMYKLVDGTGELAGGLHEGVGKIPDYDQQQRDARTEVMADPVKLANQSLHKAPNYGTGFAPYFIPLSLWVGAMVAYMLITPMNKRALSAGASPWRVALAGWLPVMGIGAAQVTLLMSVLHWAPDLGLKMANPALTIGFLMLVTGCFAAIIQWLNAKFGAAGRILVLAVLMLQLTSAGGTYPVQTSPDFFNAVHPYLPMSYVVESLRRLITGGDLTPVWQGSLVLVAFTVGALALTALAARGKQVWTMDRLHPELSL
ncbi:YhgE/Pip domain-containing protein [Streptomyces virginiae]|uniref:YhgE/Pip domain-containing protein n=1 Tax=Streptomyces TaxID=1883 RepID=UPI0006ADE6A5|nr:MULTISPECIES: YhgE/Pip domain-containing protein [unclassified Streptomyces]KOU60774.1 membrane protein [Streptomyces sp. IGB124]KOU82218.1 membrane protein [Streptomyces sp. XY58]KOV02830.1 membrane protein [Streptomyces sp. XY37]KOV15325.1 membrane protein [Streptomyces sp. XY413]KOV42943.1 membrane protein [Streptomyces sp. MMG1064]